MAKADKVAKGKKPQVVKKNKKRWSSGSARACSNCKGPDHNIRTCPKLKKKAGKKAK